ncbi:MAG: VPLPA-CTERM sorting domain-containing protein [Parvularculaceae bacterium]
MNRLAFFLSALIALLAYAAAPANATVYTVDRTVGATGSVTGTIETDGTLGTIMQANIIDWNLTLAIDDSSANLLGPLSGDNSVFGMIGGFFDATETELTYAVSGGVRSFQFCMESPSFPNVCNLGLQSWFVSAFGAFSETVRGIPGEADQSSGPLGAIGDIFVIGTAMGGMEEPSDVPLPAAAWMFLAGFGGLAAARRNRA